MYCNNCGRSNEPGAKFCAGCGQPLDNVSYDVNGNEYNNNSDNGNGTKKRKNKIDPTIKVIIKIFMILTRVCTGFAIIPLCWTIPMTVACFKKLDNDEEISVAFSVCTLIFVNIVAGILLLISSEDI